MASHIRRHIEEQNKHTIVISIVGIILILAFLAFYGEPLLEKFVLYLGKNKAKSTATQQQSYINFVPPPILDNTFSATNSATITVTGTATKKQTIKLYLNGSIVSQQVADDNGSFVFNTVQLNPGSNDLKAKAFADSTKSSDYSNDLSITYVNKGPNLSVNSPQDNLTISGGNPTYVVQGKTDSNDNVTVNSAWAIVDDQGNFSYNLQLQNGDNDIKVISTDSAGNTTTVERHLTYNH